MDIDDKNITVNTIDFFFFYVFRQRLPSIGPTSLQYRHFTNVLPSIVIFNILEEKIKNVSRPVVRGGGEVPGSRDPTHDRVVPTHQ